MNKRERQKRNRALIAEHLPKPWPAKQQEPLVVKTRHCRGYHVETQIVDCLEHMGAPRKNRNADGRFLVMETALTDRGEYVGDPKFARMLFVKRGLIEVQAQGEGRTCTIGFNPADQKWYGWSHRASCGFGVGDKLFDENMKGATDETPFVEHGRKPIRDLHDAKLAAARFAESVS
jgi:hypothetical protein